jgi:hypothetical protein
MSLLDKFGKRGNLPSVEFAAKALDAAARSTGLDGDSFPRMDPDQVAEITILAYMTRAAIVTHWLQLVAKDTSSKERAKKISDEFERLMFSQLPLDAQLRLAAYIQRLIPLTIELRQFIENKKLSKSEITQGMLRWPKEWLGILYTDESRLTYTALMHGMDIIKYVNDSTARLGAKVETFMWGEHAQ